MKKTARGVVALALLAVLALPAASARSVESPGFETYVVRPGDTLFSIACIYGDVDPNVIAYVNNIPANARLEVGQSLNIP